MYEWDGSKQLKENMNLDIFARAMKKLSKHHSNIPFVNSAITDFIAVGAPNAQIVAKEGVVIALKGGDVLLAPNDTEFRVLSINREQTFFGGKEINQTNGFDEHTLNIPKKHGLTSNCLLINDTEYNISAAYIEGATAMREGISYKHNPHNTNSMAYDSWNDGHSNESAGEHIRFGGDVLAVSGKGIHIMEDMSIPKDQYGNVKRGWYQEKLGEICKQIVVKPKKPGIR